MLDLSDTDIAKIAAALMRNSSLRTLTLDRNMGRAKSRNMAIQALADLLRSTSQCV